MNSPESQKITIRVEITIEGGGIRTTIHPETLSGQVHKAEMQIPKEEMAFFKAGDNRVQRIIQPSSSPADTSVYLMSGRPVIESNGECRTMGGVLPDTVWAWAYDDHTIDPTHPTYDTPHYGAVSDTPLTSGRWSFTCAKGNPVPEPRYDMMPGNPNNNMLIIWYKFSGPTYLKDSKPFHGLHDSSPCGDGRALSVPPRKNALRVMFGGSLAGIEPVWMNWNGRHWEGEIPAMKTQVYFVQLGREHQLLLVGSAGVIPVKGAVTSANPFNWTGESANPNGDPFRVTVTE